MNKKINKIYIQMFYVLFFLAVASADFMFSYDGPLTNDLLLNATSPYTYSQSAHRFSGTGYDGSTIDTTGCCSGQSGSCRNNPSCQCQVSVGPLPQGVYTLGNMMTFKGCNFVTSCIRPHQTQCAGAVGSWFTVGLARAIHPRDALSLRARPQDTRLRAGLLSRWFRRTIKLKCFFFKI